METRLEGVEPLHELRQSVDNQNWDELGRLMDVLRTVATRRQSYSSQGPPPATRHAHWHAASLALQPNIEYIRIYSNIVCRITYCFSALLRCVSNQIKTCTITTTFTYCFWAFTARRCTSVVHAMAQCLSVCLSVCHKPQFYGRLNESSRKQRSTLVAMRSSFLMPNMFVIFLWGHPQLCIVTENNCFVFIIFTSMYIPGIIGVGTREGVERGDRVPHFLQSADLAPHFCISYCVANIVTDNFILR